MQKWDTEFKKLLQVWQDKSCQTWCFWNDGKLNTEFLQITCNDEHRQVPVGTHDRSASAQTLVISQCNVPQVSIYQARPWHGTSYQHKGMCRDNRDNSPFLAEEWYQTLPAPHSSSPPPPPPAIQDQHCSVFPGRWRISASAEDI